MLKKLENNRYGMVHLPRLLALTIPFVFIMFIHIANVFVDVPGFLMEPVIQIAILFSGCVIAVLGMQFGLMPLFLLIMAIWGISVYYYAQFIANWI